MGGIQFSKTCRRGRYALDNVRHQWERMHGVDDKFVQFCIVGHQSNTFAVSLRDEKGRRAPFSRRVTRCYDTRSNKLCNFCIGCLLKPERNRTRSRHPIWNAIVFQVYLHPLCAHRPAVKCIRKNTGKSRQYFCFDTAITAGDSCNRGEDAGMTRSFCKSCQPMRAE